jgi:hypothetical protein
MVMIVTSRPDWCRAGTPTGRYMAYLGWKLMMTK